MKIHMKILVVIVLLLTFNLSRVTTSSEIVNAAYDYSNLSCTNEQGRDIVFVIQDTPAPGMDKEDSDQSRVSEVLALMDAAGDQDRFGLIGFNVAVTKELGLSNNIVKAKNVLKTFGSDVSNVMGNDLSVGLQKAVDELTKNSTSNDKVIVIMTVGDSINNPVSLDLAAKAYEEDITIHAISFGNPMGVDVGTLTNIANLTGGYYSHSSNAAYLRTVLFSLNQPAKSFFGQQEYSDRTLKQDEIVSGDLLIHDNVKLDLNGYDLTVQGDIILQSCSELRAVSGVISAKNITQHSRSTIRLTTSQLNVTNNFVQDGNVIINGKYSSNLMAPEVKVNNYTQKIHGFLEMDGQDIEVESDFTQEGLVNVEKGVLTVKGNVIQKGYFNIQEGKLLIGGNLTINGGPLVDEAFSQNKSLNIDGGLVIVGTDDGIGSTGNVKQVSGQLYVNNGTVDIYGDYTISDGWLTMIHGEMDTTSPGYGPGDGDYVHVHGNFSMESFRNHTERKFNYLGLPMDDQAHLIHGVLRVDGNFSQIGNVVANSISSDRYDNYKKSYSRYNFNASGNHKVLLTGKGNINVQGTGFEFNILEVAGRLSDYTLTGPVKWKYDHVIERTVSGNAKLASLTINDIPVVGFNPDVTNYFKHEVPANSGTAGVSTLKVDVRAEDYLNAKIDVLDRTMASDGTGTVRVLVTALDGSTKTYTVTVIAGEGSSGRVTSVELDREELLFTIDGGGYKPNKATIAHTVYPKNAFNQKVSWTSTNDSVVTVNNGIVTPVGVGEASIIITTEDGKFTDNITVKVMTQTDLLEGIKTLGDLVSDSDRYNKISNGLYDMTKIGIVVPGAYIQSIDFSISGNLAVGKVMTSSTIMSKVDKVEVSINGQLLGTTTLIPNQEFLFTRMSMNAKDYVEVIAYDAIGNELERVSRNYPVNFVAEYPVSSGFYSLQSLLTNPILFNTILDYYSPEQLRFTAQ